MKLLRPLAALTAAAAVALVPTAADADSLGHRDASGDLRSVAINPTTGVITPSPSTAEPTKTLGDITAVRVVHGSRTIKVVMHYRDLSKAGFAQVHEYQFLTPSRNRLVYIQAAPGNWAGKAVMRTPHGKRVRCSLSHRIDYALNSVVLKVPSSCLGRPSVIKVGSATIIGYGSKVYYDDARRVGGEWTDPFILSPRIHR
jgi:hypothetical protein